MTLSKSFFKSQTIEEALVTKNIIIEDALRFNIFSRV
jgi:hypothetical protein